ncbi:hypothetical protein [Exiguobacterium sp. HVEsp1]|uniref:hypothetical protein n=1 Tax=Exiguobacterium sp. HVEsp1 TaxID=1934003 RepID=UPI0009912461|nr:hypothetical protein [Exiguobacterium sp. HVEsp1]
MDEPKTTPFLMRRAPFFFLYALCGPLALLILIIYWRDTPTDDRGPYLFFSVVFSLFFIRKFIPNGLLSIVIFSATYTFVLFVTYIILNRKRNRDDNE